MENWGVLACTCKRIMQIHGEFTMQRMFENSSKNLGQIWFPAKMAAPMNWSCRDIWMSFFLPVFTMVFSKHVHTVRSNLSNIFAVGFPIWHWCHNAQGSESAGGSESMEFRVSRCLGGGWGEDHSSFWHEKIPTPWIREHVWVHCTQQDSTFAGTKRIWRQEALSKVRGKNSDCAKN